MADFTVQRIDDAEAIYGGAFKRIRAELGVTSFGIQVLDFPPNFEHYPEHDHSEDGMEEVYFLLGGSGELDIEGERVPLDSDTFVRVAPGTKRKLFPGPEGIRILALGGQPGKVYSPSPLTELGSPDPSAQ